MTDWYSLSMEAGQKQQASLKEAEINRLLGLSQKKRSVPMICLFLDRLGQVLVELGTGLRQRYGRSIQGGSVIRGSA